MMKHCLVALLLSVQVNYAFSQTGCFQFLTQIVTAERAVADTSVRRVYSLCNNTSFSPGIVNTQNGEIDNGDFPLVCRSNCTIQCGSNGDPLNNCRIESTGTYAIFMIPSFVFDVTERVAEDIVIKGITVDGWVGPAQIPMITASYSGSVKYEKCIFSQSSSDPFLLIDQFVDPGGNRQLDSPPSTVGKPNFLYPPNGDIESLRRPRSEAEDYEAADSILEEAGDDEERRLQTDGTFTVTFERCIFDSNYAATPTTTQAGLSLLRFRNANPNNPFDRMGTVDAKFIRNQFLSNEFAPDDDSGYRAMIDFYSSGTLTLDRNCFQDSPVKVHAPVITQEESKIILVNNFINDAPMIVNCEFIARMTNQYGLIECEGEATLRDTCQVDAPPPFCFPEDAYCQVQGQGQEVLMKDLKLGDKVLVDNGTYEPVYSFGHYNRNVEATYLKFITMDEAHGRRRRRSLEISQDHMVFVDGRRSSVPASHIQVGDKLLLAVGDSAVVREIQVVQKRGAYAPFTPSGTIVVNDFKASTFVAFQNSATLHIGGIDSGLSFQFLAHAFEGPHRAWCSYVSDCSEEQYTEGGISTWVHLPHRLALWFVAQPAIVMSLLSVPVLAMFAILAFPVTLSVGCVTLLCIASIAIGRPSHGLRIKPTRVKL